MIKSISNDQAYILQSICDLHAPKGIECDITYGNGKFYDVIKKPRFCFDIDPKMKGCKRASFEKLPLPESSVRSVMFDPPFLTYIKQGREHNSIMGKRFSGYWSYGDLERSYKAALKETHRIMQRKGVLVFKCQDIIHNHKMHSTHINVIRWAEGMFRLKDLFVLEAKSRMPVKASASGKQVQRHARVYHSYFLVLEKV